MSKENRINKARFWWSVLWTENLSDDWKDTLADTIQLPFAYCIHDKDLDKEGDNRKPHLHLITVYPNTTTYKHALSVFKLIGGEKAVNTCEAIVNIRHAYNYLIHDTETCRKQYKHIYDVSERVTGNNFDIGFYEQVSQVDRMEKLKEILSFIDDYNFLDIATFYEVFSKVYSDDSLAFEIFSSYNALIDRMCRGNYRRLTRQNSTDFSQNVRLSQEKPTEIDKKPTEKPTEIDKKPTEKPTLYCPKCGSLDFIKIGKTAGGTPRFKCKDCGKKFI